MPENAVITSRPLLIMIIVSNDFCGEARERRGEKEEEHGARQQPPLVTFASSAGCKLVGSPQHFASCSKPSGYERLPGQLKT